MTRKQKADTKQGHGEEQRVKKAKPVDNDNGHANDESSIEFDKFCKKVKGHLSLQQMREILEANDQDPSGSDDAVVPRCQDILFFGPLDRCPVCGGYLDFVGNKYACKGFYSEWSSCIYCTRDPPRKKEPIKLPDWISNLFFFPFDWISNLEQEIRDLMKNYQDPSHRPQRALDPQHKPFAGMTIALSGRLSRTHDSWREIEKHEGRVSNSVRGVTCLVVSPAERERGGSIKVVDAMEMSIPVVSEAWLIESIKKKEPQPLEAYDVVSDLVAEGKGIPRNKQDLTEEALESISAELKLYGKRGVHMDTKLQEEGGEILEKDGILFNCAFSICDQGRGLNDYCVTQLIMVPKNQLYMYYKKGGVSDETKADDRLEECDNVDSAVEAFARIFQELTGNEFEPWETEKKFAKKRLKFHPIDMDDGIDMRYGGLGLRQLGIAVAHCKLQPRVANFMKVLCSQAIYKYATMEIGLDSPEVPMGMLSNFHLGRCEEELLQFLERVKSMVESGQRAHVVWSDFIQRWFTLLPSTRTFIFFDYKELADHAAAALETVRDIRVASHLVGDMTGPTIDDPLFDRYMKLGCSIQPVEKGSDDYRMIHAYLEKTYEPIKVGDIHYGVSVQNIFAVDSSASPPYYEINKLPNKVLLWCGTRSSNLMRHLHKGFLPAICYLPVPSYMFGKAIVCSDAAAEAAAYGFTAVDRPEGFLCLAVVSLGDKITELSTPPKDAEPLEKEKQGVKGLGRKKPDEPEHFTWKDDIKVPSGKLVPSGVESPLKYNEFAVYDRKKVSLRFVVEVKYEEKDVIMETEE